MCIKYKKGFSLIEVLVSIGIVTIIMGVVFFNYSSSNDNLVVSSAGQELGVAIRQAQAYGLSVKETGVGTGSFTNSYGVYFSPTLNPSEYYIFIDRDNDNAYDSGGTCGTAGSECLERIQLRNGVTVSSICNASQCSPGGATKMTVVFRRPNTDARVYFLNSSNVIISGPPSTARIILSSPKSKTATVTIESTGQIQIQ